VTRIVGPWVRVGMIRDCITRLCMTHDRTRESLAMWLSHLHHLLPQNLVQMHHLPTMQMPEADRSAAHV
jgi:hypothetical protein